MAQRVNIENHGAVPRVRGCRDAERGAVEGHGFVDSGIASLLQERVPQGQRTNHCCQHKAGGGRSEEARACVDGGLRVGEDGCSQEGSSGPGSCG